MLVVLGFCFVGFCAVICWLMIDCCRFGCLLWLLLLVVWVGQCWLFCGCCLLIVAVVSKWWVVAMCYAMVLNLFCGLLVGFDSWFG